MTSNQKKLPLMGIFIALGISLGLALISIPNVELVTATIFIGGYLLGVWEGFLIGLLTEALYSLLNPLGMAAPPLFIAQVFSMSLAGCMGGLLGRQKIQTRVVYYLELGMAGFFSTLIFAVLTTLSFVLLVDFSLKNLAGSFVFGLGFYLLHILSNTVIFLTVVPILLRVAARSGWFSSFFLEKNPI